MKKRASRVEDVCQARSTFWKHASAMEHRWDQEEEEEEEEDQFRIVQEEAEEFIQNRTRARPRRGTDLSTIFFIYTLSTTIRRASASF